MTFSIRPDPRYPLGGHALLVLPQGSSTGTGRLTIRRAYDGRYLGSAGWQSAEAVLGPLDATGNQAALGPEIVGRVAEFDNLEISFEGGSAGSVVWPGNVLPPPAEATPGGLSRRGEAPASPDIPVAATASQPSPLPVAPPEAPSRPGGSRSGRGTVLVVLLVLVVLAIAVALYALRDDILPDDGSLEATGEAGTVIACSDEAAAAGGAEPDVLLEWVRRCSGGGEVSPEARLGVVERLIGQTPRALVVMGRWYDPAHHEADASPFEGPAIEIAARYYAQAIEAGAGEAVGLLADVCGRLDPNDFMQNDAIQTYCAEQ